MTSWSLQVYNAPSYSHDDLHDDEGDAGEDGQRTDDPEGLHMAGGVILGQNKILGLCRVIAHGNSLAGLEGGRALAEAAPIGGFDRLSTYVALLSGISR